MKRNKMAAARAGPSYPQRIITLADWGLSHNSTVTRDHVLQSAYSASPGAVVVHYIADFR